MPSAGSRKFSSGNQINIELHQNLVFTNHKFELCWHFLGYPIEVDQKPQAAAGKAEHHCPDQGLIGSPVKNSAMRTLQDGRDRLFEDYLDAEGDPDDMARFDRRMEESLKSKLKWAFKPKGFLTERFGEAKAERVANRKKDLGLKLVCMSVTIFRLCRSAMFLNL